jgi:hypothetical protein
MQNSDIIIETSTNQFKFLNSDSQIITIFYKMFPDKNIKSVCMSKVIFLNMLDDFCNNPKFESHTANFSNIYRKGLTDLP